MLKRFRSRLDVRERVLVPCPADRAGHGKCLRGQHRLLHRHRRRRGEDGRHPQQRRDSRTSNDSCNADPTRSTARRSSTASVSAADLGFASVASGEIATDAVNGSEVAANAIDSDEILDNSLTLFDLGQDSVNGRRDRHRRGHERGARRQLGRRREDPQRSSITAFDLDGGEVERRDHPELGLRRQRPLPRRRHLRARRRCPATRCSSRSTPTSPTGSCSPASGSIDGRRHPREGLQPHRGGLPAAQQHPGRDPDDHALGEIEQASGSGQTARRADRLGGSSRPEGGPGPSNQGGAMLARLRPRLTFANVCSFLALLLALGTGGAYAADTVFSTDIVDGEVKTADIDNNAVTTAKIRADGVREPDIQDGAVGGAAIATGAVGTLEIATDAVQATEVADGAIDSRRDRRQHARLRRYRRKRHRYLGARLERGRDRRDRRRRGRVVGDRVVQLVGADEIASGVVGGSEIASNAVAGGDVANDEPDRGRPQRRRRQRHDHLSAPASPTATVQSSLNLNVPGADDRRRRWSSRFAGAACPPACLDRRRGVLAERPGAWPQVLQLHRAAPRRRSTRLPIRLMTFD